MVVFFLPVVLYGIEPSKHQRQSKPKIKMQFQDLSKGIIKSSKLDMCDVKVKFRMKEGWKWSKYQES